MTGLFKLHLKPKQVKNLISRLKLTLVILISTFFLVLSGFAGYNIYYRGKIFPNIYIAGIAVGGLTPQESADYLARQIKIPDEIKINGPNQPPNLKTKDVDLKYNFLKSSNDAYNQARSSNLIRDLLFRANLLVNSQNLALAFSVNDDNLQKYISVISGQISQDPVYPSIRIKNGQVEVGRGSPGTEVDQVLFKSKVAESLSSGKNEAIDIPLKSVDPSISDQEAEILKERVEKYLGKSITTNFEFTSYTFKDVDIVKFLNPKGGFDQTAISTATQKVADQVERSPQNPKFVFDNGRVSEFQPAIDGIAVNIEKFNASVINNLLLLPDSDSKNLSFDIPVSRTPPQISTEKVNDLGIKELIGRGTSTFYHSIPSRVHNVVLAASRINGTLVKPGDTFSFNDILGDVSQFTGYQQAYIISEGKTILGDGGGVCQVSTTLFRAVLKAGLPVLERTAHAYRVGYYEQDSPPGLDATVYGPSPDLKFKNDTPGYVLIEAAADPKHYSLVFELYGTSDGRAATITKPVVTNVVAPPEDLYQDDPTLPTGTVKQIDFKAWGAKVVFSYTVTRNGEQIYKKAFTSNYRPWQAVYLRGTLPTI